MKIRYSRLWSLGNFENEKIDLERDFPENISYAEGLTLLMQLVDKDHAVRVKIRILASNIKNHEACLWDYQQSNSVGEHDKNITGYKQLLAKEKRLLRKLNKELLEV
jgi:hypothetical protein